MRAIAKALSVKPTDIEEFAAALGIEGERDEVAEKGKPRRVRPVPTTALLSERALARDWLTPEEDEAWAHL
jgi:hypothetical protein